MDESKLKMIPLEQLRKGESKWKKYVDAAKENPGMAIQIEESDITASGVATLAAPHYRRQGLRVMQRQGQMYVYYVDNRDKTQT
jgi:hypothetical protein